MLSLSKPTVKQHLAALRMLVDWLMVGHVMDANPAHAVRGPKYSQKKGRTSVLDRDEARALITYIDTSSPTGLRDRALIATMIYTFAPIGAVLQINVSDYFSQGRRGWVRLHEKGGKEHEAPCIPKLKPILTSTSRPPESAATRKGRCSAPRGARPALRTADAAGRLPAYTAPRSAGGHQNPHRQSLHAGDGHHRLS
jgi:site-specific recombinase XerC